MPPFRDIHGHDHQNHSGIASYDGAPAPSLRRSPSASRTIIPGPLHASFPNKPEHRAITGLSQRGNWPSAGVRGSTGRAARATPPTGREAFPSVLTLQVVALSAPENPVTSAEKTSSPRHPLCRYKRDQPPVYSAAQ
jgi:hypothetical protein